MHISETTKVTNSNSKLWTPIGHFEVLVKVLYGFRNLLQNCVRKAVCVVQGLDSKSLFMVFNLKKKNACGSNTSAKCTGCALLLLFYNDSWCETVLGPSGHQGHILCTLYKDPIILLLFVKAQIDIFHRFGRCPYIYIYIYMYMIYPGPLLATSFAIAVISWAPWRPYFQCQFSHRFLITFWYLLTPQSFNCWIKTKPKCFP